MVGVKRRSRVILQVRMRGIHQRNPADRHRHLNVHPTLHRLLNTLLMIVCLLVMLACGLDSEDRMVRRYAKCMTDTNTALYRMTVSNALGTVPLSAEAMEERLRGQLERGELTMGKIRADYARYCE